MTLSELKIQFEEITGLEATTANVDSLLTEHNLDPGDYNLSSKAGWEAVLTDLTTTTQEPQATDIPEVVKDDGLGHFVGYPIYD